MEALLRFLDLTWSAFERAPVLQQLPGDEVDHDAVRRRLLALVRRGQRAGVFDRRSPAAWLVAATVALGHAAGDRVAAGELSMAEGRRVLRRSTLALYGVPADAR